MYMYPGVSMLTIFMYIDSVLLSFSFPERAVLRRVCRFVLDPLYVCVYRAMSGKVNYLYLYGQVVVLPNLT